MKNGKPTESLLDSSNLENMTDALAPETGSVQSLISQDSQDISPEHNLSVEEVEYKDTLEEDKQREAQKKEAERIMKTPEFKASVLFNNYIKTNNVIMSGPEKKRLYREFLRKAKKGRYDYLFDPDKIARREEKERERQRKKFEKLNTPIKYTVDDIPEDVQKTLLSMVDKEPGSEIDS